MTKKCLILSLVLVSAVFIAFFEYAEEAGSFEEIQLTDSPTYKRYPHWSYDGTWIYFHDYDMYNIYRARTDGSGTEGPLVPSSFGVYSGLPCFDVFESSPDTGWMLFLGGNETDAGLWRMTLPDQSCTLLTTSEFVWCPPLYLCHSQDEVQFPVFSPNGAWFAFAKCNMCWQDGCDSLCPGPDLSRVLKIQTNGSITTTIAEYYCTSWPSTLACCVYTWLNWSPDGNWIACLIDFFEGEKGVDGLYKVPSSGGDPIPLAVGSCGWPHHSLNSSWSPDGNLIVYRLGDRDSLCIISSDGGTAFALDRGREPVWSPYANWIAYDDLDYGICLIDPARTCKIRVAPLNQYQPPSIAWSPDGASLAYNKLDSTGTYQIYVVNIFPESLFVDSMIDVAALSVKADQFDLDCDSLRYTAKSNVRMGNETGGNYYFHLGDSSEAKIDSSRNSVYDVVPDTGNAGILSRGEKFKIDSMTQLNVDAPSGHIDLAADVYSPDTAIHESIFRGDCTLDLNGASLTGEVKLSDFRFAQLGFHAGRWDLNGCPFMGIQSGLELTTPVDLTDLTLLSGDVTLGVFVNTGIIRVGLTTGALEYREFGGGFGFDLSGKLGLPTEGTIDVAIDRINVVDDVPIGIPLPVKESETTYVRQEDTAISLPSDKGEKTIVVDAGLTIKGEEDYTDANCNGHRDPGETYIDENQNGIWDEGTNILLFDDNFNPIFYLHGHATLDLTLISYIHFTVAEALVTVDYPTNNRMDFEIWTGLKLGNVFEVDLSSGELHLDWRNHKYHGRATLTNPDFSGLAFGADMDLTINADTVIFIGDFSTDFTIQGVNIITGNALLYLDKRGFYTSAHLDAFGLLTADGTLIILDKSVAGFFLADFSIDGWHFGQLQNRFYFAPHQCMSGAASVKLCAVKRCKTIPISYRICSAANWKINIGGLSISLGSPANLHIYDSQGRHTGINAQGEIETGIPGSEFYVFEDIGQQLAFLPDPDLVGGYTIDVEGLADSVFDLDILYPNKTDGNAYNVGYFEAPTQTGALHRVNLDVNNNWTLLNDLDGDSVFESQAQPDSTAQATLDTTMVIITNVASEIVCANDAKITWKTNVPATSEVLYRSAGDTVYISVSDTILTTNHSVIVDHILTTDTCYYIVVSVDTSGNIASFLEKSFKLEYIVGDANGDGVINVTDVVYLINYLFIDGPAPVPIQAGDANCDGFVNVTDVVYLINYLFIDGPPPCN